jgi:translation initiation factor IF-3
MHSLSHKRKLCEVNEMKLDEFPQPRQDLQKSVKRMQQATDDKTTLKLRVKLSGREPTEEEK